MYAIAITLATDGKAIGLASLGTSLTEEQAAQLHALGRTPIIATDADSAGQAAAERDYWTLATYGVEALQAHLQDAYDPAELVANGALDRLVAAINAAQPLADTLASGHLDGAQNADRVLDAHRVVVAQPSARWTAGIEEVAKQSGIPSPVLQSALVPLVQAWNTDPRLAASHLAGHATRGRSSPEPETSHFRGTWPRGSYCQVLCCLPAFRIQSTHRAM